MSLRLPLNYFPHQHLELKIYMRQNNHLNQTVSAEMTGFATAICKDALRDALHDLDRAAEAAFTLKAENGNEL